MPAASGLTDMLYDHIGDRPMRSRPFTSYLAHDMPVCPGYHPKQCLGEGGFGVAHLAERGKDKKNMNVRTECILLHLTYSGIRRHDHRAFAAEYRSAIASRRDHGAPPRISPARCRLVRGGATPPASFHRHGVLQWRQPAQATRLVPRRWVGEN